MKENPSNLTETSSSSNQNNQGEDKPVNKRLAAALAAKKSIDFSIELGRFAKIKKPK